MTLRAIREWTLRHLARPGSGQSFVPELDGLRFVAILAVVLYHLQGLVSEGLAGRPHADLGWLHRLLSTGWFGVPLFFAISGFIISRPFFENRKPSLPDYFLRRLSRLEPPYVANLLIVFVLKVAVLGVAAAELAPHLLASLVYLHGPVYGTQSEVNGVAWSLEVEWQFYLLAPLLVLAVPNPSRPHVVLGTVLFLVFCGWLYTLSDVLGARISISIVRNIGFFLAGMVVARCYMSTLPRQLSGGWADLVSIASATAIVISLLAGPPSHWLLPLLTCMFLFGSLRGVWIRRTLSWWPLHTIGGMCYSIYLYHFFVLSLLGKIAPAAWWSVDSPNLTLLLAALMATPVVLVLCALPYKLIERPFMVWRPRKTRLVDAFRSAIVGERLQAQPFAEPITGRRPDA